MLRKIFEETNSYPEFKEVAMAKGYTDKNIEDFIEVLRTELDIEDSQNRMEEE